MAFKPRMSKCKCCRKDYLKKAPIQKFCCETCRDQYNNEGQFEEQKTVKTEKTPLQQKMEQARALGMSYGKYVAMLEARERTV